MIVRRVDPAVNSEWDGLVRSLPDATLFHSSFWFRVIKESYGYTPYSLVLEEPEGHVVAVLPSLVVKGLFSSRRLVSLPFTDFCGPLFHEDADLSDVSARLAEELQRADIQYAELRSELPNEIVTALSIEPRVQYHSFCLDLTEEPDTIWSGFKSRSVRMIRRAQKEGLTVSIETAPQAMAEFCRLNRLTRRRHGVIPQPDRFFRSLYENAVSTGHGSIFVVRLGTTPIAASVFLFDDKTMFYKYGASDLRVSQRGYNHLIFWRAIEWAARRGLRRFDMGRTDLSNEGLLMFKRGWGADEFAVPYSYWPKFFGAIRNGQSSITYRIAKRVVRTTPLRPLQFAGNRFYRFFG